MRVILAAESLPTVTVPVTNAQGFGTLSQMPVPGTAEVFTSVPDAVVVVVVDRSVLDESVTVAVMAPVGVVAPTVILLLMTIVLIANELPVVATIVNTFAGDTVELEMLTDALAVTLGVPEKVTVAGSVTTIVPPVKWVEADASLRVRTNGIVDVLPTVVLPELTTEPSANAAGATTVARSEATSAALVPRPTAFFIRFK
jgi:hypothetical protein